MNKTTLSIEVAAKEILVATVQPADATDKKVSWSSSDKTKVVVSNTGEVTGVAVGNVDVTVTTADGDKTAVCTVTVTDPAGI